MEKIQKQMRYVSSQEYNPICLEAYVNFYGEITDDGLVELIGRSLKTEHNNKKFLLEKLANRLEVKLK